MKHFNHSVTQISLNEMTHFADEGANYKTVVYLGTIMSGDTEHYIWAVTEHLLHKQMANLQK